MADQPTDIAAAQTPAAPSKDVLSQQEAEEKHLRELIESTEGAYGTIEAIDARVLDLQGAAAQGRAVRDTESVRVIEMRLKYLAARREQIVVPAAPPDDQSAAQPPDTGEEEQATRWDAQSLEVFLTGREAGLLEDAGIKTIAEMQALLAGKDSDMTAVCSVKGIGRATARTILAKLAEHGIKKHP